VVIIAVPLGILVTRRVTSRLAPGVLGVANLGQAAPSLGLLALFGFYFIGFWAVAFILTAYAALSVLRNTIVGLNQVDKGMLDAARGMGMSPAAILFRVELPTAVPIIGAGVRTALVLAVGTVPLGYALDAGGLGLPLFGAIKTDRQLVILTTAIMIACLALLLDWIGGVLQRAATPRGIR
jgi:osmoprotectant transport system permease protein